MEPKKNPEYDVHQMRGIIFNISILISMVIVVTAFRWTAPIGGTKVSIANTNNTQEVTDIILVPVTTIEKNTEPAPQKTVNEETDPINFSEIQNTPPTEELIQPIEEIPLLPEPVALATPPLEYEGEEICSYTCIYDIEMMPEPAGGMKSFSRLLKKNLKYPALARRNGIEGTVFIEFEVTETGDISNVRVIKGIGFGCDEEAMRAIALSQWTPGIQGGRPVKARMVQPIKFSLSHW